ncbi:MAG: enhanced serine sensitivity protein SseB C-terminal domain-containing protein [Oscillospiraceae bacterium]|nr:enhanced serine sensitivity protein SseB C-terminal domain-containing protein [Oscillospiraceae bacterium]
MAQMKKPTVKNPELVAAISEFRANSTAENEKAMTEAIKNSKLIAPVIMDDLPDNLEAGEKYTAQAKFMLVQQKDGTKLFPVFTEWLELLKWKNDPECKTVTLEFDQFCTILGGSLEAAGLVINPGEEGLLVSRQKMSEISGKDLTPKAAAPAPVAPAPEPEIDPERMLFGSDKQTNPELLAAINAFRQERTPAKEQAMVAEIRKAKFVAPVQMADLPKDLKLKKGESHQAQVKFVMIQRDNKKYFPLFTDQGELARWKNIPEHKTILLTFDQYSDMIAQQGGEAEGLVINPFGAALPMPKQQVLSMRNGAQIYDLKNIPADLVNKLSEHFETEPKVHAAWIMGLRMANKESYMILVDHDAITTAEEQKALYDPIANIVGPFTNGNPCGIVPANAPQSQPVIKGKIPFYKEG